MVDHTNQLVSNGSSLAECDCDLLRRPFATFELLQQRRGVKTGDLTLYIAQDPAGQRYVHEVSGFMVAFRKVPLFGNLALTLQLLLGRNVLIILENLRHVDFFSF